MIINLIVILLPEIFFFLLSTFRKRNYYVNFFFLIKKLFILEDLCGLFNLKKKIGNTIYIDTYFFYICPLLFIILCLL